MYNVLVEAVNGGRRKLLLPAVAVVAAVVAVLLAPPRAMHAEETTIPDVSGTESTISNQLASMPISRQPLPPFLNGELKVGKKIPTIFAELKRAAESKQVAISQ